jgi:hypothetical protein
MTHGMIREVGGRIIVGSKKILCVSMIQFSLLFYIPEIPI